MSYDLETLYDNALESSQKALVEMQIKINIQEAHKYKLQHRQNLMNEIKMEQLKQFQKQLSELEEQKVLL